MLARAALIMAVITASFTAGAADRVGPPDRSTGMIDGKAAVMVWPNVAAALPGCDVHLVPVAQPDRELRFPCASWFLPEPGTYKVWAEADGKISPTPLKLIYGSGEGKREGIVSVVDLMAAGEIALRDPAGTQRTLRLVSLDSFSTGRVLQTAFDRRADAATVTPIRMPVGRVLAGIFDSRTGDAVALARPVEVTAGGMTYVAPAAPKAGSDVLAVIDRARVRQSADQDKIALTLHVDDASRAPDVVADTSDRIIAVWYGVDARRARITSRSDSFDVSIPELTLVGRPVVTVRAALRRLPSLRVSVGAPENVARSTMRIAVRRTTGERIRSEEMTKPELTVEGLPGEELDVLLTTGELELRKRVDLRSYEDADVAFEVKPLTVSGNVSQGGQPVAANVSFSSRGSRPVVATADERGAYSAQLWAPAVYEVQVAGDDVVAHTVKALEISDDRTLDIELPRTRCELQVRTRDGQPVADARVTILVWNGTALQQRHVATSGDDGRAALPPLRAGRAQISAEADDFLPSEREVQIADTHDRQVFVVELEKAGEAVSLVVQLPGGRAASGAELMVVVPGDPNAVRWRGQANADGTVAVPDIGDGILLARHAEAAGTVVDVPANVRSFTVQLPAAAPILRVRAEGVDGRPARFAGIALWLKSRRLQGAAVHFLANTQPLTNGDGVWTAAKLPLETVRVLVYSQRSTPNVLSGSYDTLASVVPFPWPDDVVLRAVQ